MKPAKLNFDQFLAFDSNFPKKEIKYERWQEKCIPTLHVQRLFNLQPALLAETEKARNSHTQQQGRPDHARQELILRYSDIDFHFTRTEYLLQSKIKI